MFEQVVSAPRWTIVRFVFAEILGGRVGREEKAEFLLQKDKKCRCNWDIWECPVSGPIRERQWNEACKTRAWTGRRGCPLTLLCSRSVSVWLHSLFSCIFLRVFYLFRDLHHPFCLQFCSLWCFFIIVMPPSLYRTWHHKSQRGLVAHHPHPSFSRAMIAAWSGRYR